MPEGLLQGKTALITGCLKGIGHETMELFARQGCSIWAGCLHEDANFEASASRLAAENGVTITPLYFDLDRPDEVKDAMKQLLSAKAKVDILLNIAGMTQDSLFLMTSMESMKHVFEVNFFSQILITQYVTKLMMRHKAGSVVFVSSYIGIGGSPGQISYSASKAALIGATKTLASELAEYNIRVNAVAPGVIQTDMITAIPLEALAKLRARIPMGRTGLPSEVAGAMLFLASDLSTYVTGQVLRIDGGIR